MEIINRVGWEDPRFVVSLFDPSGPRIQGPDGGIDHAGYNEADLRRTLVESYALSDTAIDALLQNAKATTVRD